MAKSPKHPASEHHHQAASYTTTLPPIIIIKPPITMTSASTKTRRGMPKRLTNIASRDTSTPRPLANILINDGHRRRRWCRLLFACADHALKRPSGAA